MDAKVTYDEIADTLFVRWGGDGGIVHYIVGDFAVLLDKDTNQVIGLHIENWTKHSNVPRVGTLTDLVKLIGDERWQEINDEPYG